jgi:hemolysin activation/secretion protein
MRKVSYLVFLAAFTFAANFAHSQALPDAAQTGRQATNPAASSAAPEVISGAAGNAPVLKSSSNIRLPVKDIAFSGNTQFDDAELTKVLGIELNTPDGVLFEDLESAVDRVTRFYRAKGFALARAYLPRQSSTNGVINVLVLEGHHSKRIVNNTSDVKLERIQGILQEALCDNEKPDCVGAIVTESSNERAVNLVNDLPGVRAKAVLEPGVEVGTTRWVMDVKKFDYPKSTAGFDNYGSKSTGLYRLSASHEWQNMAGEGDIFSLSGSASNLRIWSGNATYSRPVNYMGTRMGASYAHGQYLLGDSFATLNAHGDSNTFSGFVTHPIVRHRDRNFSLRGNIDYKILKDHIEATQVHYDKRNTVYNFGGYGDWVDNSGYNIYSFNWINGNLRMLDAQSVTNDALAQTRGSYGKLAFSYARQQSIQGAWTGYVGLNGISGNKNLDGSEKIGLGGPSGVRGYPAGEGSGDKGVVGNFELRYTSLIQQNTATLTYVGYLDRGWVQTSINSFISGPPSKGLTGYGVGILIAKSYDYNLRVMYATHSSKTPSVVDPGAKNQLWVQASKNF